MKIDPIKFEVIRNGFLESTEEMAVALRKSAYSTNIKTRCDFPAHSLTKNSEI